MSLPLAYHESGHAVLAGKLGARIKRVHIAPDGGAVEYDERCVDIDILTWPIVLLAGPIAETKHLGVPFSLGAIAGTDDDRQLRKMVVDVHGDADADARLARLEVLAAAHVTLLWPIIERVAAALMQKKELSAAELAPLLIRRASDR